MLRILSDIFRIISDRKEMKMKKNIKSMAILVLLLLSAQSGFAENEIWSETTPVIRDGIMYTVQYDDNGNETVEHSKTAFPSPELAGEKVKHTFGNEEYIYLFDKEGYPELLSMDIVSFPSDTTLSYFFPNPMHTLINYFANDRGWVENYLDKYKREIFIAHFVLIFFAVIGMLLKLFAPATTVNQHISRFFLSIGIILEMALIAFISNSWPTIDGMLYLFMKWRYLFLIISLAAFIFFVVYFVNHKVPRIVRWFKDFFKYDPDKEKKMIMDIEKLEEKFKTYHRKYNCKKKYKKYQNTNKIFMGVNSKTGKDELYDINDLSMHYHILGGTGTQKTTRALMGMLIQLLHKPNAGGQCIITFKKDKTFMKSMHHEAKKAGKKFYYVTFDPNCTCHQYNPVGNGVSLSIADRIVNALDLVSEGDGKFYSLIQEAVFLPIIRRLKEDGIN